MRGDAPLRFSRSAHRRMVTSSVRETATPVGTGLRRLRFFSSRTSCSWPTTSVASPTRSNQLACRCHGARGQHATRNGPRSAAVVPAAFVSPALDPLPISCNSRMRLDRVSRDRPRARGTVSIPAGAHERGKDPPRRRNHAQTVARSGHPALPRLCQTRRTVWLRRAGVRDEDAPHDAPPRRPRRRPQEHFLWFRRLRKRHTRTCEK